MGSRDADIDFTFTSPTSVRVILDALAGAGWSVEVSCGRVEYMINDADDTYEWRYGIPDDIGEVVKLLDALENLAHSVAVNVHHPAADTGGMLMFLAGRTDVSFVPSINRRRIQAAPEFTDLAWYLHSLVPALVAVGLEGYEANEVRY
ncbi:hypothetical protein [Streptomyces sp. NPDC057287]|uniref:hypothetical protein n=1 Tax=Streptomyces sp. NPDC057287 TaxID=3346086 RepID=UPI00363945E8